MEIVSSARIPLTFSRAKIISPDFRASPGRGDSLNQPGLSPPPESTCALKIQG
ncbi:MAG: hypothetical protein MZU91_11970 [Desulfosudis oleivorans]|nr:hypothetical protein [Desulfosudis oleivorans]